MNHPGSAVASIQDDAIIDRNVFYNFGQEGIETSLQSCLFFDGFLRVLYDVQEQYAADEGSIGPLIHNTLPLGRKHWTPFAEIRPGVQFSIRRSKSIASRSNRSLDDMPTVANKKRRGQHSLTPRFLVSPVGIEPTTY